MKEAFKKLHESVFFIPAIQHSVPVFSEQISEAEKYKFLLLYFNSYRRMN